MHDDLYNVKYKNETTNSVKKPHCVVRRGKSSTHHAHILDHCIVNSSLTLQYVSDSCDLTQLGWTALALQTISNFIIFPWTDIIWANYLGLALTG